MSSGAGSTVGAFGFVRVRKKAAKKLELELDSFESSKKNLESDRMASRRHQFKAHRKRAAVLPYRDVKPIIGDDEGSYSDSVEDVGSLVVSMVCDF
jgi:hypothetical protein